MDKEKALIAVVDDDPSVLRSVVRLLSVNGFDTAPYAAAKPLLADLEDLCPMCVVADLAMPEISGLELQQHLAEYPNDLPIVFLTGRGDVRSSVLAMRGGAVDFLLKPVDRDELLNAIRRAVALSTTTRQRQNELGSIRERMDSMTPREREVYGYVVEGYLNKQIASELGITLKTVKVHRARMMQKMRVRSVAKLARLAERIAEVEPI